MKLSIIGYGLSAVATLLLAVIVGPSLASDRQVVTTPVASVVENPVEVATLPELPAPGQEEAPATATAAGAPAVVATNADCIPCQQVLRRVVPRRVTEMVTREVTRMVPQTFTEQVPRTRVEFVTEEYTVPVQYAVQSGCGCGGLNCNCNYSNYAATAVRATAAAPFQVLGAVARNARSRRCARAQRRAMRLCN